MLKTKKSLAKRIWRTGRGKYKRTQANKSHLLGHKSKKRKRHLRKAALVSSANTRAVRRMLPYG